MKKFPDWLRTFALENKMSIENTVAKKELETSKLYNPHAFGYPEVGYELTGKTIYYINDDKSEWVITTRLVSKKV